MTPNILHPHPLSAKDNMRFWSKIDVCDPDDCWEWQAAKFHGYGIFKLAGQSERAHRLMWEIVAGPIPEGMHACHHCDNPSCVNFAHLFLGTHKDNMRDMAEKERAYKTKLNSSQVAEILTRLAGEETRNNLAKEYGVAASTIERIALGKTWKHISRPNGLQSGQQMGERHCCAKLTADKVREIRRRYANGESQSSLAKRFGVSRSGIGQVVRQESWKHIK